MRIILALCLVLFAAPCLAQNVTLAWDLSPSEPLGTGGGYKCYTSKTSGVFSPTPAATVAAGVSTVTISGLPFGRSYFVCTAYVSDGTESDYSNQVDTVIKPKPPKLNTAQQVAQAFKGAATRVAGIFRGHKQLRIVE